MAGPKSARANRDDILAIDVGARMTKAVVVRRKGAELALVDYAFVPTPVHEKGLSVEQLAEHLRQVLKAIKVPCRRSVVTLGAGQMVMTHADLPQTTPAELRKMIKLSPKTYLQQDLPDHFFDCYFRRPARGADTTASRRRKSRVLVGAARRRVVEEWSEAAKQAGLVLQELTPVPVAVANAFRLIRDDSHPEPVALLDIGAAHSIINIVQQGELVLTRTVALGSDKFADVLTPEGAKPSGAESEEEQGPEAPQAKLQKAILSFSREVDASVGFYTSQQEKHVSQLFVSGGTARSQFVLQMLESELSLSCESWNLIRHLAIDLPEQRQRELEYEIPQLTVAIGAATGFLREDALRVNLLAEEQEAVEERRRDPVRRARYVAAGVVGLIVAWSAWLWFGNWQGERGLRRLEQELAGLTGGSKEAKARKDLMVTTERRVQALESRAAARFLMAPVLNALQYVIPEDIDLQWVELRRDRRQEQKVVAGKRVEEVREQYILKLVGRSYGENCEANLAELRARVESHPFFKSRLQLSDVKLETAAKPTKDLTQDGVPCVPFTYAFPFLEQPRPVVKP